MPSSPRGTPEMSSSQALKEENHNEAIRRTEAGACHFPVADRLTTPPGSCADGAIYIVTATATGPWTGKEGQLATAVGANASNGWYHHVPIEGFTAYVQDENARYLFDGAAWVVDTTGGTGVDNDTALASDSTTTPPSVHAVRGYVAAAVTGLLDFKGGIDCSANPNYPTALKGDTYIVSAGGAGKIGGASGTSVDAGDVIIAKVDTAAGDEAAVGANWFSLEHNSVFGAGYTDEQVRDVINAALAAGAHVGVLVTTSDGGDSISLTKLESWPCNFTSAGDLYIFAEVAMTIDSAGAAIGTGTLAYAKSTAATPSTFSSTTLPATLEAGAWLKVTASSVTGFVAKPLKQTA